MSWIKHAWFDIAVTVVIVLATFGDMEWARWAIMVYTPFMLAVRVYAYAMRFSHSKIKASDAGVPPIVYHVLYAANVLVAAYFQWWWIAGCWAVIWVLSTLSEKDHKAKTKSKSKT